jgi:hypothetical protein
VTAMQTRPPLSYRGKRADRRARPQHPTATYTATRVRFTRSSRVVHVLCTCSRLAGRSVAGAAAARSWSVPPLSIASQAFFLLGV